MMMMRMRMKETIAAPRPRAFLASEIIADSAGGLARF